METTHELKSPVSDASIVKSAYQIISIVFLVLAAISFTSASLFFYSGFTAKATFLLGYTALNLLFAYGLWKREQWMFAFSLINFIGISLVKISGFLRGTVTGVNCTISIAIVAIFAGFIYATRPYLRSKHSKYVPILVAYLALLVPVLLRSIGIL